MSLSTNRQLILDNLDQVPPLHQVAHKLISLMSDEGSSARDLDRLIRTDQSLTARVLKFANSSTYGRSREIFELTEAVVLLGHGTLSKLVLASTVADAFGSQLTDFAARAWAHSLSCAEMAQAIAQVTGVADPEQAFVAGLMHDIGLLVMAQAAPDALATFQATKSENPLVTEREIFGLNHPQVGQKLLDKWHLPPALCEAVRYHHVPKRKYQRTNTLVNLIALADQLSALHANGLYSPVGETSLFPLLRMSGVTPEKFGPVLKAWDRNGQNTGALAGEAGADASHFDTPPPAETVPVWLHITDDAHRAWYTAIMEHFKIPVVPQPVAGVTTHVVVDFHGAPPEERAALDRARHDFGLDAVVIGDRRHTPQVAPWPQAPHLPEIFCRDQILSGLTSSSSSPDLVGSTSA